MSLQLIESFEDDTEYSLRATTDSNTATNTSDPRTGTRNLYLQAGQNRDLYYVFASGYATMGVAFGLKVPTSDFTYSGPLVMRGDTGSTNHISLSINNDNSFSVKRGAGSSATTLASTGPNAFTPGVWHHVELEVTLSDTVGTVKLRVDGKTPTGWTDLTNVDTKNGGTATTFDSIRLTNGRGLNGAEATFHIDDLIVYYSDGSGASGLQGDVRVYALLPNGNGNYSQLTGQDADSVDNYLNVDEAAVDDDTTYNESSTDGNKDTYTFDDLTITVGTIVGIEARAYAKKDDVATKAIRLVHRRGTTDSVGSDRTLSLAYNCHYEIWDQDPAAGPGDWTITNVNSSEFGVEVRP